MKLLFCIGSLWLGYVYFGYPLLVWVWGRLRPIRPVQLDDDLPMVSVLISARNEEKDIGWKVAETLAWDYPSDRLQLLVASDASEDRTDEILQAVRDPRLVWTRMRTRCGKNAALNHLARQASGDLLFFTDANSHIDRTCLRRMIRHFADTRVGCVTGVEENVREEEDPAVVSGGRAFLGYESLVKSLESRVGSVLICDGAIFCIRRPLFTELRPDLANDLELPLHIGSGGYWILCDAQARALERGTRSAHEEFARRRRISAQGALGMWKLRSCLRGVRGLQFASRKLLRWLTLVPLFLILPATAALASSSLVFAALLGLQAAFYGLALLAWVLALLGRDGGRWLSLPFYFLLANLAALTGVIEACRGSRYGIWEAASLTRGGTTNGQLGSAIQKPAVE